MFQSIAEQCRIGDDKIKHYSRLFEIKGISKKSEFYAMTKEKVNSLAKYCKMDTVTRRSLVELWKTAGKEEMILDVKFDNKEASMAVQLLQMRKEQSRSISPLTDTEQAKKD